MEDSTPPTPPENEELKKAKAELEEVKKQLQEALATLKERPQPKAEKTTIDDKINALCGKYKEK